ncbi:MAG TPA: DNA topoisomerase IB [Candidatus Saccharimonadia bacterium]|nr:DNA topoisomerase IB [Candidatus Saccharimonadia bacterium]
MTTEELLEQANLRFSSDIKKGYGRKFANDKPTYFNTQGEKITEDAVIERINKLAIPPAWESVWICPYKNGYLQATGLDSKGRKQYRYHTLWNELSSQQKFEHMILFAEILPKIRGHVRYVLDQKGHTREKVLATVVWLLENTLIRVGNEEYEEENKSYGLTTLKNRHADVSKDEVHFSFKGKSGVYHDVHIKSKKVAKVVKQCQELPGQELFEYRDDEGKMQNVSSHDVNEYLKEISGEDITAKNFRTWAGSMLAARMLSRIGPQETDTAAKKTITQTVKKVSSHLRNLPSTCRKYYIHPAIFTAYAEGYTLSNVSTHKKFKTLKHVDNLNDSENGIIGLVSIFEAAA